jgi:hypothetical protein
VGSRFIKIIFPLGFKEAIQSVKVVQLFEIQIDQGFVSDSFNPAIGALTKII